MALLYASFSDAPGIRETLRTHLVFYAWQLTRYAVSVAGLHDDYDTCGVWVMVMVEFALLLLGTVTIVWSAVRCQWVSLMGGTIVSRRNGSEPLHDDMLSPILAATMTGLVVGAAPFGYCISFSKSNGPLASALQGALFFIPGVVLDVDPPALVFVQSIAILFLVTPILSVVMLGGIAVSCLFCYARVSAAAADALASSVTICDGDDDDDMDDGGGNGNTTDAIVIDVMDNNRVAATAVPAAVTHPQVRVRPSKYRGGSATRLQQKAIQQFRDELYGNRVFVYDSSHKAVRFYKQAWMSGGQGGEGEFELHDTANADQIARDLYFEHLASLSSTRR